MNDDNAVRNEDIHSESCIVKYVVVINTVLTALLLLLIAVLVPVSDRLQKKEDRKKAERSYDCYFSSDKDDDVKYNRNQTDTHYSDWFDSSLFNIDPKRVIRSGLRGGKSRDEIIEDLIDAEEENRWLGRLGYDNLAFDIMRWSGLVCIAVILFFAPALAAAADIVRERRYVIVKSETVFFSSKKSAALSDVIRAETGFPKKVTVVTHDRRYKRRFIRNNCEIAEFINERCNNAAQ